MSPKLRAHGSELHGPPKPRWPITSDLRQEPGALAAHAGICAGGSGVTRPLPRQLARPKDVERWSMTTMREKLIKIGAKVVCHGRYVTFQLAEVAVPRKLFRKILSLIDGLQPRPPARC